MHFDPLRTTKDENRKNMTRKGSHMNVILICEMILAWDFRRLEDDDEHDDGDGHH